MPKKNYKTLIKGELTKEKLDYLLEKCGLYGYLIEYSRTLLQEGSLRQDELWKQLHLLDLPEETVVSKLYFHLVRRIDYCAYWRQSSPLHLNSLTHFRTYVGKTINNLIMDKLRKLLKQQKDYPKNPKWKRLLNSFKPISDPSPEQEETLPSKIKEALKKLNKSDPQAAEAFYMVYVMGYEIKETAAHFGISVATTHRKTRHAKHYIKRLLYPKPLQ